MEESTPSDSKLADTPYLPSMQQTATLPNAIIKDFATHSTINEELSLITDKNTLRINTTTDVLDKLFKSARSTPAATTFVRQPISSTKKDPGTNFHELERLRSDKLGANQPVINEKSRNIVRKSAKFSEPIFSDSRYEQEIQRYRTKRNFDVPKFEDKLSKTQTLRKDTSKTRVSASRSPLPRLAQTSTVSGALERDQSFSKHKFRADLTPEVGERRVLNLNEFAKKYEAQRTKWERNRNL